MHIIAAKWHVLMNTNLMDAIKKSDVDDDDGGYNCN